MEKFLTIQNLVIAFVSIIVLSIVINVFSAIDSEVNEFENKVQTTSLSEQLIR